MFVHQGSPRFSWDNGQKGQAKIIARLDRFYTPKQGRLSIHHWDYFIHGYSVGSDHSPIQIELRIGSKEGKKSAFKWNMFYLKDEIIGKLGERWEELPKDTLFFYKLRNISRLYRHISKLKARENRKLELNTKAKLEVAT